jgi:hypothetical protein
MELPRTTVGLGPIFAIVSAVAVNDLIFLFIQVKQDVEFVQTGRFRFQFVPSWERRIWKPVIKYPLIDKTGKIWYIINIRLTPTSPVLVC